MIYVTLGINLAESELEWRFSSASGPGGQNVNRVSAAVQLRFDVLHSPALPERIRNRLMQLGGKRITVEGELVIKAQRYRSQERNRNDALNRLLVLIRTAAEPQRLRRPTETTLASNERRVDRKVRRGQIKRLRRQPNSPPELED